MFTKAANIKPSTTKAHHPAFNRTQQSDSFIPSIQPKLQVDSANSVYEAEADRMADHVVSTGAFIQPSNFVSSNAALVQTSSEPIATQAPELDAGELADQLMPPMPGEDSKVTDENAEPEKDVEEEKTEKQEPETVEKEVKETAGKEDQKTGGGGMPAPQEEKEELPAAQEAQGEEVTAEESAAFTAEPVLEPVAPIEITPDLTKSVIQTKIEEAPQHEEEQEVQEEQQKATDDSPTPEERWLLHRHPLRSRSVAEGEARRARGDGL